MFNISSIVLRERIGKLIKLEQQKIQQAQTKIIKIREGFEGDIYTLEEAKLRIDNCRDTIAKTARETQRLGEQLNGSKEPAIDVPSLRSELKKLAEKNLTEATFQEKREVIGKLGIRVYPSEDLKMMKIKCGLRLNIEDNSELLNAGGCRIVTFGLPKLEHRPCRGYFERIRMSEH